MTITNDQEPHKLESVEEEIPQPPQSPLDEEIHRIQSNTETYGGDDIHEPVPKSATYEKRSPRPPSEADPNLVSWDGPNDPTNPQNWSTRYKWFITLVCIIMTVNV